jgi:hypothetical protein
MLMPSKCEADSNCPLPPSTFHLFSPFLCTKLILLLFFSQDTPLHNAAQKGHLEICRLLLQCNADVGAKDRE